jgi:hypothetical protein
VGGEALKVGMAAILSRLHEHIRSSSWIFVTKIFVTN